MNKGWIKLHRELLEKPIWYQSSLEQKVILITLLLMANHEERSYIFNGEKIVLKAGQIGTSLERIAEKTNKQVTQQNIRTALKKFERLGFLTNESTKCGRLITIVNWGIYQDNESSANKEANSCLTKDQQTANKALTNELTPNKKKECKNDKNVENEKKKDICAFFESLWVLYPNKKGKSSVSDKQKEKLYAIGFDEMKRAIERYSAENVNTDMQYWKYGSTFFNSGYIDYLDENYTPRLIKDHKQAPVSFMDVLREMEGETDDQRGNGSDIIDI